MLIELAEPALQAGVVLGPDQILDFTQPPILGGALEPGNLQVMDFEVALNLAGQIHQQVAGLPEGTPIEVDVEQPSPRRGLFGRRKR
ncbi:T6SS immunity protein Tdi1 domain-containing protein [Kribbella lupini]|uniref:T6SS immunity protein Tdi1 C-terminal domain-containing protein n=1 Tax=Kribbella lupini TaxID=291602 RepID=A0ABP4KV37_9ACTN